MQRRDFSYYCLSAALHAVVAEANDGEALSRRLHARTKLRLMPMSEEALREPV